MSFRDLLRSQLLDKFRRAKDKGGVYLLIFDDESKEKLESYADIQDAMTACGASYADKLFKKRQPQPDKNAIYFISPNEEAIQQINQDFKNPERPKYNKIHFLFTSPCSAGLYSKFSGKMIDPRVATKQEIIIDIYVGERNVYHFNKPDYFRLFFLPIESDRYLECCKSIVDKLKDLFVSLGDYPKINFMKASPHPYNICKLLQKSLEDLRTDTYSSYPVSILNNNRKELGKIKFLFSQCNNFEIDQIY